MGPVYSAITNRGEAVRVSEDSLYYKQMKKLQEEMTPWERVKALFEEDEVGQISPKITACTQQSALAFLLGGFYGGIQRMRLVKENVLRSTAHELFETPRFAQRNLQDRMMLGFGDGGLKLGWRLALFTVVYNLTSAVIQAYRGKAGVLEHVGGGAAAGMCFKLLDGPKPTVAGAVIGGSLGLAGGTLNLVLCKLVGVSPDDIADEQNRKILAKMKGEYDAQKNSSFKLLRKAELTGEFVEFHETFLANDDLSLANVKGSNLYRLKESAEKGELVEELLPLIPKALEGKVKTLEELQKERSPTTDTNSTSQAGSSQTHSSANIHADQQNAKTTAS